MKATTTLLPALALLATAGSACATFVRPPVYERVYEPAPVVVEREAPREVVVEHYPRVVHEVYPARPVYNTVYVHSRTRYEGHEGHEYREHHDRDEHAVNVNVIHRGNGNAYGHDADHRGNGNARGHSDAPRGNGHGRPAGAAQNHGQSHGQSHGRHR